MNKNANKVLAIQHVRCETPGTISDALAEKEISVVSVRAFEGETVPAGLEGYGGLVVMGGPMGVYEQDRYPFLRDEIQLIREALQKNLPVLGVCLGSQLLAAAAGAPVKPGRKKEIGWYRIALTPESQSDALWTGIEPSFTAFHWHGDIFELPAGAVPLASSDRTHHQSFRFGASAYAILFHMEVSGDMIREMVETFRDELESEGLSGSRIVGQVREYLPRLNAIGRTVFSRWTALIGASPK